MRNEVQKSYLGKYEEIFRETANKKDFSDENPPNCTIETIMTENSKNNGIFFYIYLKKPFIFEKCKENIVNYKENSLWVEKELQNAEEWRPKNFEDNCNIESVILFEDIEPFLKIFEKNGDFSLEIVNNFLDFLGFLSLFFIGKIKGFFKGFPLLNGSLFVNIEDNCLSEFYYSKIQRKLHEIQKKTGDFNEEFEYVNMNSLDFFLKFWSLKEANYLKKPFEELKIEYLRRILHQIYVNFLGFFIEIFIVFSMIFYMIF